MHKLNPLCEPFTGKTTDENTLFLNKFVRWLTEWKKLDPDNGRLSKETHSALIHSNTGFLKITEYCTKELKLMFY